MIKIFYMSEKAAQKTKGAQHSHAVNMEIRQPLCGRVKLSSLVLDDSIAAPGELPTCPACLKVLSSFDPLYLREKMAV